MIKTTGFKRFLPMPGRHRYRRYWNAGTHVGDIRDSVWSFMSNTRSWPMGSFSWFFRDQELQRNRRFAEIQNSYRNRFY